MILFDSTTLALLRQWVEGPVPVHELSLINAGLNVTALGALAYLYWRSTEAPVRSDW